MGAEELDAGIRQRMDQKRRAVKESTGQSRQEGIARKEKGEKPCSAVSGDEAGCVGSKVWEGRERRDAAARRRARRKRVKWWADDMRRWEKRGGGGAGCRDGELTEEEPRAERGRDADGGRGGPGPASPSLTGGGREAAGVAAAGTGMASAVARGAAA